MLQPTKGFHYCRVQKWKELLFLSFPTMNNEEPSARYLQPLILRVFIAAVLLTLVGGLPFGFSAIKPVSTQLSRPRKAREVDCLRFVGTH